MNAKEILSNVLISIPVSISKALTKLNNERGIQHPMKIRTMIKQEIVPFFSFLRSAFLRSVLVFEHNHQTDTRVVCFLIAMAIFTLIDVRAHIGRKTQRITTDMS